MQTKKFTNTTKIHNLLLNYLLISFVKFKKSNFPSSVSVRGKKNRRRKDSVITEKLTTVTRLDSPQKLLRWRNSCTCWHSSSVWLPGKYRKLKEKEKDSKVACFVGLFSCSRNYKKETAVWRFFRFPYFIMIFLTNEQQTEHECSLRDISDSERVKIKNKIG